MNRQDIFNRAVAHLLKQEAPAMDGSSCLYRTARSGKLRDGKACGIGGIIPDHLYSPSLEGTAANNSRVIKALGFKRAAVTIGDKGFLLDVQQRLHDNIARDMRNEGFNVNRATRRVKEEFTRRLAAAVIDFATRHELELPPLP
jgi:hypothetical protein